MIGLKRDLLGLQGVGSQRVWSGLQEKPRGTQQSSTYHWWHWMDVRSLAAQQEEASADRSSASGPGIRVKVNTQELTLFMPWGLVFKVHMLLGDMPELWSPTPDGYSWRAGNSWRLFFVPVLRVSGSLLKSGSRWSCLCKCRPGLLRICNSSRVNTIQENRGLKSKKHLEWDWSRNL